tara:strand:- start:4004 stop:6565 length:2562 start_codon:yes stop_codon:yes gene_type:complete
MAVDKRMEPVVMADIANRVADQEVIVDIENPDSVSIETEDGGMIIDFDPDPSVDDAPFDSNLAEYLSEDYLNSLAQELVGAYEDDLSSRKDWEDTYIEGLDLLGLKIEDRTEPWPGACGVHHPLLAESVIRFQSQAISELFPAQGPARTKIIGEVTSELYEQSGRVQTYLNYLLTEEMSEFRAETERMLFSLPLAGSSFKKVYYDPNMGRPCSMFIPAEDVVVYNGATDLRTLTRMTHRMRKSANEIRKLQVSGFYRDIELNGSEAFIDPVKEKKAEIIGENVSYGSMGSYLKSETVHTILEIQVDLDIEGFEDMQDGMATGIAVPYVVTVDKGSSQVLSIRRNFLQDDPLKKRREHFIHYEYIPGLGFYGLGLVHLIGGLVKSSTSILRQLIDAGTLANLPGGLKTRGMRIIADDTPIMPGEFRDVDVPGGSIKENISFLPYKEPSGTLYQLLGNLVEEARRFASMADVKAADMNSQAPVGTTLALIERNMKVMSAIQARLHAAMKNELRLISRIVKDFGPSEYPYQPYGDRDDIVQDFSDQIDVIPVANPNASTMSQRIMQYQAALQLAQQAPQLYDLPALHRQMLEVLGIRDPETLVPEEDQFTPKDPVTENMDFINGKPAKAFAYQDHEAHIQTHLAGMRDPKIMELMAQAPNQQAIMGAVSAHIAEHLAFQYRIEIEKQLGIELPSADVELPPQVEAKLSSLVAQAAEQLLNMNRAEAQQQQQAAQAQDPVLQLKQRELALEEQEAASKAQIDQQKVQNQAAKIAQDQARAEMRQMLELLKIEAAKEQTKMKIDSAEKIAGAEIGANIVGSTNDRDERLERQRMLEKSKGAEIGRKIAETIVNPKRDA